MGNLNLKNPIIDFVIIISFLVFLNSCKSTVFKKVSEDINLATTYAIEEIYLCLGYLEDYHNFYKETISFLEENNAKKIGDRWILNNDIEGKSYIFYIVLDALSVQNALMKENSHVIIRGHSNFGLGPVFFKDEKEFHSKRKNSILDNIKYIDDNRILNISSRWIDLPIANLRINNKLINWWPEYKDGSSGIAAYEFSNSVHIPPYNYYLTYQIPNDPNFYKILDRKGKPIERFPFSKKDPWFSKKGIKPDPSNPSHQKYFITNKKPIKNYLKKYGNWKELRQPEGYYGENFLWTTSNKNTAEWHFEIPLKGEYRIYSWSSPNKTRKEKIEYILEKKCLTYQSNKHLNLPINFICADMSNATASRDALKHDAIATNNKKNNQWVKQGMFELDAGKYILKLKNLDSNYGVTIDAIRIAHKNNPPDTFNPSFFGDKKRVRINELVTFYSNSKGDILKYIWDFGDGNKVTTHKKYIFHQYNRPGIYDVSLEIYDYQQNMLKENKKRYIAVGQYKDFNSQPDFSGYPYNGQLPLKVSFTDRSSDKIKKWYWNFGDGFTSTEQNPKHTYSKSGNYTVSLSTTDVHGKIKNITKKNFIAVFVLDIVIDNINYPKPHYSTYTIIDTGKLTKGKNKFLYKRLFFDSCNVDRYFLESLRHGIVFYSAGISNCKGMFIYLKSYLNGKNNNEILKDLDEFQVAIYSYFDFNQY